MYFSWFYPPLGSWSALVDKILSNYFYNIYQKTITIFYEDSKSNAAAGLKMQVIYHRLGVYPIIIGNFSQMADPSLFWEPLIRKMGFILHFRPRGRFLVFTNFFSILILLLGIHEKSGGRWGHCPRQFF